MTGFAPPQVTVRVQVMRVNTGPGNFDYQSDAEWDVMECVWEVGECAAADVIRRRGRRRSDRCSAGIYDCHLLVDKLARVAYKLVPVGCASRAVVRRLL